MSIVFHAFYRICIRRLPTLEEYRQEGDQEAEKTSNDENAESMEKAKRDWYYEYNGIKAEIS